jgi:hypothetical protein
VALILYDQLNTPIVEQQRAQDELLKFLRNKPRNVRFAFCVLSERLQMIQGFIPEESLLVRAIKSQKGSLRYNSMLSEDAESQQTNRKYDEKFRKIKVSLAASGKNLRLIHRSGYFAVDPNAPAPPKDVKTGFGSAAMQHGSPLSHQLLFAVRVIPIGKPRKVEPSTEAAQPTPRKNKKPAHDPHIVVPLEAQHYAIDYVITPAQLRFDSYR